MARILVVDDSPAIHQFVRTVLEPFGHVVETLPSFVTLSAYLSSTPPDLVLLDLEMPGLSGLAFAHFIRKFETRRTRILVHSSADAEALSRAVAATGAVGAVEKGRNPDVFAEAVTRALKRAVA